jgi:cytochrome P450
MNIHTRIAERPPHVPAELVRDFNHYDLPGMTGGYTDDIHVLWKHIQDTYPDVFWSPHFGGFWACTRYREIEQLVMEPERFSSSGLFVPSDLPYAGTPQLDAPEHPPFRKLVSQAFTPASLNAASVRARAVASQLVEEIRPRGRCEFLHDFIGVMPIVAFLNLLGMPESEAPYLHDLASRMVPGQPGFVEAGIEAHNYIADLIKDREAHPKEDFVTMLVSAEVMGRKLTEEERQATVQLVVTGGLDTVINMSSFAMAHFARNPEIQRDLKAHPDVWDGAVEEISRRFGTSNLGRTARHDTELGGARIAAGDQIIGIYPLSGLDERVNPDPMTFDPRRKGRKHLNFGSGPHTCLGARLARREIKIFIEEWVAKMPVCRIVPGTQPRMSSGLINSMRDLYLEWDPA